MLCIESINDKRKLNFRLRWFSYRRKDLYIARQSRFYSTTCIERGTRINGPILVKGEGKAAIGKYCAIGDHLTIITSNHNLHHLNLQNALQIEITGDLPSNVKKKDVHIGHNVWIGDNVIILPGVEIGSGAIIGAGSVVTRTIDPFQIAAGNPAKKIGDRFSPEITHRIAKLHWWDWPVETIHANKNLFMSDFSEMSSEEIEILISSIDQ